MEKKSYKQNETGKNISWMDLNEEELLKVTDVSVCMYSVQS